MLGLESSVKWRGTDKVRATSLALPPVYARCLPENALTIGRIAVTRIGLPGPSSAYGQRRRAHDPLRSGPSPARPWRYPVAGVARAAPGCRAAVCPATSRPARGQGEIAGSTGQTWRVSAHSPGRHDADRMSGQGTVVEDAAAVAPSGRRAAPRPCPADPTAREYGGHAAPAWRCPPAWWVGRSLTTRPEVVSLVEPPEDAPARGDQHPARIGVRQGP
jgi:hypothetical protein